MIARVGQGPLTEVKPCAHRSQYSPAMLVTPLSPADASAAPAADRTATEQGTCYHCGLPNPRGSPWRSTLAGTERRFCCAGCQGVAETVHAAGLDAFYAQRTAPGTRPDAAGGHDEWVAWDEPAMQAGVVRDLPGGGAEASLLLEGVHCSACTWLIETWLAREPGVTDVSVNYATRRARVRWDGAHGRLSAVLRAVARIGYRAHPYDPARREALALRESRALLTRMAVAVLAMMQVMMFAVPTYISLDGVEPAHRRLLEWASLTLTLPAILYSAWPFFRGALRDLRLRRLGMDVPIALGLGAAFVASAWATLWGAGIVYYDSITMFIALLLVARYVELVARRRAGDAIESAARARPAVALRVPAWPDDRASERVASARLAPGDVVLVRPGDIAPADGVVLEGRAALEEAMLTGEARPCTKEVGDRVLAGSIARDGAVFLRVEATGAATRLAAIERLVEQSAGARPHMARLADRVASHFVAVLLAIAVAAGVAWIAIDAGRAFTIVFAVLAVSCPCALSLATPAALAAATGALSRRHVVITRPDALEALARVTHVVFDKTGTLTIGRVALLATHAAPDCTEAEALALAAALEQASEHPVAEAFRGAAHDLPPASVQDVVVVPGAGVEAVAGGERVRLGAFGFVRDLTGCMPVVPPGADTATLVALGHARRGVLAVFALGDEVRPTAALTIERMRALGLRTVLLSGDRSAAVAALASRLGIDQCQGEALPETKRNVVGAMQVDGAIVAMVGDGINDAPALAQADVSVSLGSATPLAQWTADVVVLSSDLDAIADTAVQARRAMRVVRQNLMWAFAYNAVAIPAAALGHVTPLFAALGMSASSLLVVLNAMRAAALPRAVRARAKGEVPVLALAPARP